MTTATSSVLFQPVVEGDLSNARRAWLRALDAALLAGLCALLLFGPLAFGAVERWAVFTLQLGATLLFLLWAARQAVHGTLHVRGNPLLWPMLAFAAVIALQIAAGISAYAHQTNLEALNYAAYGALFFLLVQCLRRERDLERLCLALAGFGFLYAVFALVQNLTWNGKLYWLRETQSPASGWGVYVNHNHYAGLMEMLIPFALVLALIPTARREQRLLAGFAVVVMAATVVLSGSRGGTMALLAQFIFLGAMLARGAGGRLGRPRVLLLIALLTFLFLAWTGWTGVAQRFSTLRDPLDPGVAGMRLDVTRDSFAMFRERPILGWGLGVFSTVYPRFQSFPSQLFMNEAHNDYAQLLVEMGLVGFAVTLWFLVLLFRRGLRNARRAGMSPAGMLRLAALAGCLAILVHSVSDFHFRIPANALLFLALCAIATSTLAREERAPKP